MALVLPRLSFGPSAPGISLVFERFCSFCCYRKEIDSRFSSWEDGAECLVLWVPSLSRVLVARSATHKNKRQDMVYDRSQFFFFYS